MTNIEKLKTFIKENNLEFNSGSGGDVNILALCGYACYIQASLADIEKAVIEKEIYDDIFSLCRELERVFNYADTHNYSRFWNTEKAKKQYTF